MTRDALTSRFYISPLPMLLCIKSTSSEAFRSSAMSCPTCTTTTPRSRATRRPSGCSARMRRVPSQLRRSSIFFCNVALFVGFHECMEKNQPILLFFSFYNGFCQKILNSVFTGFHIICCFSNNSKLNLWFPDFQICSDASSWNESQGTLHTKLPYTWR